MKTQTYVFIVVTCLLFSNLIVCNGETQWRSLQAEEKRGLSRFNNDDYAFPVEHNLYFCRKNLIEQHLDISMEDYGPIIQKNLKQLHLMGGGTLRLESGTYWIKTQIEIPAFTCIQGAGMDETTLKAHPESPAYPVAGMIRTRLTARVSILDLTQDGNRNNIRGSAKNRYGIYSHLTNYLWIKNVRVTNNKAFGFDPHGSNTAWSYFLVIENCVSRANGYDGFTIDQYSFVSVLNSWAMENDRHGINVVSGSRYVLIKGNRMLNNMRCSISVQNNEFGTRDVRINNNVGVAHGSAAICIRNTIDIEVFGNKMYSESPKASLCRLEHSSSTILVDNEWVAPDTNSKTKMISHKGVAEYIEVRNKLLWMSPSTIKRYKGYFVARNHEHPQVRLNTPIKHKYANNKLPHVPRRLLTRSKELFKSLSPRYRTEEKFDQPIRNNPLNSDPKCEHGIRNGTICCPQKCGTCDLDNCVSGEAECCSGSIRRDASSCDTFLAPCVLSRKHL